MMLISQFSITALTVMQLRFILKSSLQYAIVSIVTANSQKHVWYAPISHYSNNNISHCQVK